MNSKIYTDLKYRGLRVPICIELTEGDWEDTDNIRVRILDFSGKMTTAFLDIDLWEARVNAYLFQNTGEEGVFTEEPIHVVMVDNVEDFA